MSGSFVRIPPDSTGKKIATSERLELSFDNLTGTFSIGDIIVGATSNASGILTAIIMNQGSSLAGELYLKNSTGTFIDNEPLQVSTVTIALANIAVSTPATLTNTQLVVISDPNNPENQQKIDAFGATVNTFTDGSPVFSPFGGLINASLTTIADYKFSYDANNDKFYDNVSGAGATVTHIANESSVKLSIGTVSGEISQRTSHLYHPYSPGTGNIVLQSVILGDTGKTNVRRRWGIFDDNNGCFWEVNGTTLNVVVRSSTTGSPVDEIVAQSNFNIDTLSGFDQESFILDVSKSQVYWIEFQWLGTGIVKFGIYNNEGFKLAVHRFEHANFLTVPYSRTATLPIRYEQENLGTSGSTSEMKIISASVKSEGPINYTFKDQSVIVPRKSVPDTSNEVPLVSFRPRTSVNTVINRIISFFSSLNLTNISTQTATIRIRKNVTTLTAASWADHSSTSALQVDTSSTAFSGGEIIWANQVINGGELTQNFNIKNINDGDDLKLMLNADGTTQPIYSITVQTPDSGSSNVLAIINWKELLL